MSKPTPSDTMLDEHDVGIIFIERYDGVARTYKKGDIVVGRVIDNRTPALSDPVFEDAKTKERVWQLALDDDRYTKRRWRRASPLEMLADQAG